MPIEFLKKARLIARVTCAAGLLDFKKQRVFIAIHRPADDALHVAARLTFHPVFLPRAGKINHHPFSERHADRLLIHPRHHQHALAFRVLDDGRDEAVCVVFELADHIGKNVGC